MPRAASIVVRYEGTRKLRIRTRALVEDVEVFAPNVFPASFLVLNTLAIPTGAKWPQEYVQLALRHAMDPRKIGFLFFRPLVPRSGRAVPGLEAQLLLTSEGLNVFRELASKV